MNMKKILIVTILLTNSVLYAESVILYKNYLNQSLSCSKNAMMAGATTATAKGYSAIFSNPAGLSSNQNFALYAKSVLVNKRDSDDNKFSTLNPENQVAMGFLYDEYILEYKLKDYLTIGSAYGIDTNYGHFSFGLSYLYDMTNRGDDDLYASDEFATGDYPTYGFSWQKSFIGLEDFYAFYFGYSKKMSGRYSKDDGNTKIVPVSPEKTSYGFGLETNFYKTSLLFTYDYAQESWLSSDEQLISNGYGMKWLIVEKFSIAAGYNSQEYINAKLSDAETIGFGLDLGLGFLHINSSYMIKTINNEDGNVYLKEDSIHLDIATVF